MKSYSLPGSCLTFISVSASITCGTDVEKAIKWSKSSFTPSSSIICCHISHRFRVTSMHPPFTSALSIFSAISISFGLPLASSSCLYLSTLSCASLLTSKLTSSSQHPKYSQSVASKEEKEAEPEGEAEPEREAELEGEAEPALPLCAPVPCDSIAGPPPSSSASISPKQKSMISSSDSILCLKAAGRAKTAGSIHPLQSRAAGRAAEEAPAGREREAEKAAEEEAPAAEEAPFILGFSTQNTPCFSTFTSVTLTGIPTRSLSPYSATH